MAGACSSDGSRRVEASFTREREKGGRKAGDVEWRAPGALFRHPHKPSCQTEVSMHIKRRYERNDNQT